MTNASLPLAPLDVRIRLAALWTTTMIIVAFVDIFGSYRLDIRQQIDAGKISGFEIDQFFMLGTIVYVIVPTLMIALSILLPHRSNRSTNVIVALIFALTIVGAAIGEWGYYLFASVVELGLLATIVTLAFKWTQPKPQVASAV